MDTSELQAWAGREKIVTDALPPFPARGLAALLEQSRLPEAGDPLPAAWHWLYFLETPRPSQTGPDGHPLRGDFLPPVALERRMWASGSLQIEGPLILGLPAERVSRIRSITPKTGDSGPLVFVGIEHRLSQAGQLRIVEDQTLVYRAMPTVEQALPPARPANKGAWEREAATDAVTLFKYSALTLNGHRIHYDRPYARAVEHYPDLVVHGPLLATWLLDLATRERPNRSVRKFSFKAVAPTFDSDAVVLHGEPSETGARLWSTNGRGAGMTAEIEFDAEASS